jgi:hypothetical protein
MIQESQFVDNSRLVMRDISIEILPRQEGDDLRTIFGTNNFLSVRGIELSKVLYQGVSQHYWHSLRKNLKKPLHESTMAEFIAPEVQLECFKDLLGVIADDETPFTISVRPWSINYSKRNYSERYVVVEFNGKWIVRPKAPPMFYVPPYLRRFLDELGSK